MEQIRDFIQGVQALVILFWVVTFVIFLLRVFLRKKKKHNLLDAYKYINESFSSKKEFCLILRPFGNDGYILKEDKKRNMFRRVAFRRFIYLEELIESKIKNRFGIETIALVDPKINFIPHSPKSLSSSNHNWKDTIQTLIRRALLVVVIIPPEHSITKAVEWELKQLIFYGLIERTLFILPPPNMNDNFHLANYILNTVYDVYASDFSEEANQMSKAFFIYCTRGKVFFEYIDDITNFGIPLFSDNINNPLSHFENKIKFLSFSNKYPYHDERFKLKIPSSNILKK